jgi:hypothetical protein
MFGLPFGIFVEGSVSILLAVTIGYCVVLNARLQHLHSDRDTLRQMIADLVRVTDLANAAVKELKSTAAQADLVLNARLEEAERFGVELANHVSAGQSLMERIIKITSVARHSRTVNAPDEPSKAQSALQQLASRPRIAGKAA